MRSSGKRVEIIVLQQANKSILDLHVHSTASWDGFSSVEQNMIAAKAKGYSVLGCVEHDAFPAIQQPFSVKNGLVVLAGSELSIHPFHVLVFGNVSDRKALLSRFSGSKTGPLEAIERLNSEGLYTVLAHPFRLKEIIRSGGFKLIESMASKAFLVEAANGRSFLSNLLAGARVPVEKSVAGSDSHHVLELGNAYTIAEGLDFSSLDGLFSSLRSASKKNVHSPNLYSLFYSRYLKFKEKRKKLW